MDEVDYKNLFETLQAENEKLRENIMKLKFRPSILTAVSWYDIMKLMSDPRYILGFVVGVICGIALLMTRSKE